MTPEQFSQKIKAKYPEYKDMDDVELSQKIVAKYPVYASQVNFRGQEDSNVLVDVAKGVAKSAGQTALGVGKIGRGIQKTIASGAEKVGLGGVFPTGEPGVFDTGSETEQKAQEVLNARNTAQEVGKIGGDILQFVIPATAVGKATTGSSLISRMIAEGGTAGIVAMAQEGEAGKTARDTAIISALLPGAGAVIKGGKSLAGGLIGKEGAGRIIDSLIKPLKKDLAYGKQPGKTVASEGITAKNLDELDEKISERLTIRMEELNNTLAKSGKTVTLTNPFSSLDEAMEKAAGQNNTVLLNRLQGTKQALSEIIEVEKDEAGQFVVNEAGSVSTKSLGARNLTDMTPVELTQLKRDIGEMTNWTGNASDDQAVNAALQKVYRELKSEIEKAVPESKALNETIGDLISAQSATKNRAAIAERMNILGFTGKQIGTVGAGLSLFTGNPAPAILGLGLAGLEKAMGSTAVKTQAAKWLAGASKQEKQALFDSAPWIKGVLQKTMFETSDED